MKCEEKCRKKARTKVQYWNGAQAELCKDHAKEKQADGFVKSLHPLEDA